MHRSQQCEDGNRIQPLAPASPSLGGQDRQGANAQPDYLRRREQTTSSEQLNPECAGGVAETIVANVPPTQFRRRSPSDADRGWQFDPVKARVLPTLTALDAIQPVRSGPCVAVRGENYRCSRCMRPINDRLILPNGFATAATKTRWSRAGPRHTTHEKS